ncbi:hypothetical protein HNR10_004880 [Nocardiopsis aegyptia]|uniref:Uncharacterized protein n=1 Tax=Nocardiopsis aegyptia TaxID=220378 RepID=A0A7Z0ERW4_9ACTN|nr:hypothetical protein [Nocardiopsis aegyptia]
MWRSASSSTGRRKRETALGAPTTGGQGQGGGSPPSALRLRLVKAPMLRRSAPALPRRKQVSVFESQHRALRAQGTGGDSTDRQPLLAHARSALMSGSSRNSRTVLGFVITWPPHPPCAVPTRRPWPDRQAARERRSAPSTRAAYRRPPERAPRTRPGGTDPVGMTRWGMTRAPIALGCPRTGRRPRPRAGAVPREAT